MASETVSGAKSRLWKWILGVSVLVGIPAAIVTVLQYVEPLTDPRKELAGMGVGWTLDDFNKAVRSQDVRALSLFFKGGLDWVSKRDNTYLLGDVSRVTNPEAIALFASQKERMKVLVCDPIADMAASAQSNGDICFYGNAGSWGTLAQKLGKDRFLNICGPGITQNLQVCQRAIDADIAKECGQKPLDQCGGDVMGNDQKLRSFMLLDKAFQARKAYQEALKMVE